jgi:hypothetical protein
MKKIIALSSAAILSAAPAYAGVYGNIESNSGWSDGDYNSTLLETHLGVDAPLGNSATVYVQGGPAVGFIPDQDDENYVSGKVGVSYDLTERLTGYGEVSAITADEYDFDVLNVGVKAGATYRF